MRRRARRVSMWPHSRKARRALEATRTALPNRVRLHDVGAEERVAGRDLQRILTPRSRNPTGAAAIVGVMGEGVMSRFSTNVNITRVERIGRVVVGLTAVVGAAVLLRSSDGALAVVLLVLMALAGVDLVVTGVTGHCPLYQKLGRITVSARGRTS